MGEGLSEVGMDLSKDCVMILTMMPQSTNNIAVISS